MINAIAEGVTFDFLMDGKGAMLVVVVELHLRGIVAGFAVNKITNSGVFDDHFGPEGVARKAEKIRALIGGDFDDDIGPTGENMLGVLNFFIGKSICDDVVEGVISSKKFSHGYIIS